MKNLFILFALLSSVSLLVPACTRCHEPEDLIDPVVIDPPPANQIRFDSLAVGQRSRYLGFEGYGYYGGNGSEFSYSDDTLILEIVGQDANGFRVAETLHYVDTVSNWYDQQRDSTYFYYLTIQEDTLHLVPSATNYVRSRLFVYYQHNDGLYLVPLVGTEVSIKGWKSGFPYCECWRHGFTKNYLLFDKTYAYLNVLMQDSPMQVDGNGHTYVYSAQHGIVKLSQYSWWTSTGYGWDLLPE